MRTCLFSCSATARVNMTFFDLITLPLQFVCSFLLAFSGFQRVLLGVFDNIYTKVHVEVWPIEVA